ncbi:MAG: hypothetical protein OEU68_04110 [Nitrospira sp.]|nr:hypothetical protein [Nitrospira sp.]MDH4242688.1 hypothetical protein [Nitrospira sp.]MDH4355043.1 hypothetical protein [Nitrospira sp.]MDH5316971.1 hypothetical protein [Nitrospira sp.]
MRQHSDKTIIGRIARGFDVLDFRFSSDSVAVVRCLAKVSQSYERSAASTRIGTYLRRWPR